MAHAWDVVGYSFDGALYCVDCVRNPPGCDCGDFDDNGICVNNCHGYGPRAPFAADLEGDERCDSCGGKL